MDAILRAYNGAVAARWRLENWSAEERWAYCGEVNTREDQPA